MGNKEEERCLQLNWDLLWEQPLGFLTRLSAGRSTFVMCEFPQTPSLMQGSPRQRNDVTLAITPSSSSTQQRGWKDSWLNLPFLNGPLSSSSLEAPAAPTSDKAHLSLLPFILSAGPEHQKSRWVSSNINNIYWIETQQPSCCFYTSREASANYVISVTALEYFQYQEWLS